MQDQIPETQESLDFPKLAEYEQVFQFNAARDLEGKRVLDLGSGNDNFGRSLRVICPQLNCEVISLDHRDLDKRIKERASHVKAKAQLLPFEDNSFDLILASLSVPHWIFGVGEESQFSRDLSENKAFFLKEMLAVLDEAARVLKVGGEAKFSPWVIAQQVHDLSTRKEFEEELTRALEKKVRTEKTQEYSFFIDKDGMGAPMGHLVKEPNLG